MSALFVYGSLRAGAGHPMHATLAAAASKVGPAKVRGRLYRVDWYPGLVLDETAGWVHGELWSLRDESVLAKLDAYEGTEFQRVSAPAVRAWVYVFIDRTEGLELIQSGDWLQ